MVLVRCPTGGHPDFLALSLCDPWQCQHPPLHLILALPSYAGHDQASGQCASPCITCLESSAGFSLVPCLFGLLCKMSQTVWLLNNTCSFLTVVGAEIKEGRDCRQVRDRFLRWCHFLHATVQMRVLLYLLHKDINLIHERSSRILSCSESRPPSSMYHHGCQGDTSFKGTQT